MFKELDNKWLMALGLEELGAVVALQWQPTWDARLIGAAAALREAAGSPPEPTERTNYQRGKAYARSQLGDEAFAAAMREGRLMTPEQVLATQGQATVEEHANMEERIGEAFAGTEQLTIIGRQLQAAIGPPTSGWITWIS